MPMCMFREKIELLLFSTPYVTICLHNLFTVRDQMFEIKLAKTYLLNNLLLMQLQTILQSSLQLGENTRLEVKLQTNFQRLNNSQDVENTRLEVG